MRLSVEFLGFSVSGERGLGYLGGDFERGELEVVSERESGGGGEGGR